MFTGDLTSEQGRQDYENYIMNNVRNEINSYTKQSQSNVVSSVGSVVFPSGIILSFAGGPGVTPDPGTRQDVPDGWLLCSGLAVSRVAYSGLFTIIGTTYGVGDGSTTFNVPDLRGRAPYGKDNMGGTASNRVTNAVSLIPATTLGAVGGDQNMHLHTHIQNAHYHHFRAWLLQTNGNYGGFGYFANLDIYGYDNFDNSNYSISSATATNQNSGTGISQNMPPTIITNYIIKT